MRVQTPTGPLFLTILAFFPLPPHAVSICQGREARSRKNRRAVVAVPVS